jgi:peptide/nickel transport system substrate-binding protein
MNRRIAVGISILLLLALTASLFIGCGSSSGNNSGTMISKAAKKPGETTFNKEKVMTIEGSWSKLASFNGNYFNSDGKNVLQYFVYESLFTIIRVGTGKTYYQLAESIDNTENKTIVHLRKNIKWHDGYPFTSKDIWAYYTLNNKVDVLKYVQSIETPDDYTFVFNWMKPAVFDEMKLKLIAKDLSGTVPYHIYKECVDRADELLKSAKPAANPKLKKAFGLDLSGELEKEITENWERFKNAGPKTPIGTGPYKFESVDDKQVIVAKNKDYYDADKVYFEKLKFIKGGADLAQEYAMLRDGDFHLTNGTPPKDILETTLAANTDLVYYKMFDLASYGIYFNIRKSPFNEKKFRQAISYIIDKKKVREVGNYYGKEFNSISAIGFPPSMMKDYLVSDMQLTDYTRNEGKAARLLSEIGWKKGSDGIWVDKDGKKANFTIACDVLFDTALNSAQAVAEQLTEFGLNTRVKAVDSSIVYKNAKNGDYDMLCYLTDMCWSMNEAWDGIKNAYVSMKDYTGFPDELKSIGYDGKEINVYDTLNKYPYIQDPQERKRVISELAYIYNENAYVLNLFQTTYGVWINMKYIDGNFPMADQMGMYNRNMPVVNDPEVNDRICEMNYEFQSNRNWVDGNFWPR